MIKAWETMRKNDNGRYSYRAALAASQKVNWRIEDIIGGDKQLDFSKPFMPESLARVEPLDFLSAGEKRTLNQIRGHAYLSIFGLVEEFILPFVLDHARPQLEGDDYRTRAFLQFAAQEDTSRQGPFVMDNDEPAVLLGTDQGANPVEVVLHALAGCLTTSLVYHAAAQGIKIDGVESRFEGELDLHGFLGLSDHVRNGYENIRVTFKINADAPQEKLEELCRLAQKRSPVFDIVSNPVPVSIRLET
ncbi:MAG: OsmC family protein [Acidobacteria bacterium]|nr:OsmC family protein [Acidobacteriota bacterium]